MAAKKALPLALHPPINSIGIKEQIKHDGEEEPTLLPGVFLSLFFSRASNPKNKTMREELQSTCHSCPARGFKIRGSGRLIWFFSTSLSLSTSYLPVLLNVRKKKKKNSRGGIAKETHGKMSSEIKRTMAFYDLKPSPSNA